MGLLDYFLSFDMYGRSIAFTYKGREKYNTWIGTLATIIISIIMILYAQLLLNILINEGDTSKATNSLVRDLFLDKEDLYINNTAFTFAFTVQDEDGTVYTDESYVTYEIFQQRGIRDGGGGYNFTTTEFNWSQCGTELFPYENLLERSSYGIEEFTCPMHRNLSVQGNSYNTNYNFFEIVVKRCSNSSGTGVVWADTADIDSESRNLTLNLALVNSYFDYDDYKNPIHTYLDDRYQYEITPDYEKTIIIYLKNNEVELKDR